METWHSSLNGLRIKVIVDMYDVTQSSAFTFFCFLPVWACFKLYFRNKVLPYLKGIYSDWNRYTYLYSPSLVFFSSFFFILFFFAMPAALCVWVFMSVLHWLSISIGIEVCIVQVLVCLTRQMMFWNIFSTRNKERFFKSIFANVPKIFNTFCLVGKI